MKIQRCELAFRSMEFRVPENLIFPALQDEKNETASCIIQEKEVNRKPKNEGLKQPK